MVNEPSPEMASNQDSHAETSSKAVAFEGKEALKGSEHTPEVVRSNDSSSAQIQNRANEEMSRVSTDWEHDLSLRGKHNSLLDLSTRLFEKSNKLHFQLVSKQKLTSPPANADLDARTRLRYMKFMHESFDQFTDNISRLGESFEILGRESHSNTRKLELSEKHVSLFVDFFTILLRYQGLLQHRVVPEEHRDRVRKIEDEIARLDVDLTLTLAQASGEDSDIKVYIKSAMKNCAHGPFTLTFVASN